MQENLTAQHKVCNLKYRQKIGAGNEYEHTLQDLKNKKVFSKSLVMNQKIKASWG